MIPQLPMADKYGAYEDVRIADVLVRFRLIPAGVFMMGSPEGDEEGLDREVPREVELFEPFWLAETPVTQALWEAVTGENPSSRQPGEFEDRDRPVETVDWKDVMQFIDKVEKSQPGLALQLPTQAQWEYACRAGTTTARYGELDAVAWYAKNSGGETHPVKQKQANAWGLYDMLGNVGEWAGDTWRLSSRWSVRGGHWGSAAYANRAAYRDANHYGCASRFVGFRLSRRALASA